MAKDTTTRTAQRSARTLGFRRRDAKAAPATPRATFRQLLAHLFANPGMMAAIIAISVVFAGFQLAQPLLVNLLITNVEHSEVPQWIIWTLLAVVLIGSLIQGLQHYLLQRTGESIVLRTRRRLIAKLLRLPISEFDARRTGDLVSRVGADTTLLRAVLTQGLIEAAGGSLTFLGAAIAMLILDPVLLLVTVAVIGGSMVLVGVLALRVRTASAAAQAQLGTLTSAVERAVNSVRTIRAAGAVEREEAVISREARTAYERGLDVASASAFIVPVSGFAVQAALIGVLGVGGVRVAAGLLSIADLITFMMFLFMMIMPLGLFFGAVTAVSTALGALGRIEEILALPTEDELDAANATAPQITLRGPANTDAAPFSATIAFDGVSFRYPTSVVNAQRAREAAIERLDSLQRTMGSGRPGAAAPSLDETLFRADAGLEVEAPLVLDQVTFSVPRGTRTALVGPSGAGKSTTLALIERFYDPTAGAITLGGVDLTRIDRSELRTHIGYVEQDAPVLAGTLRDNLLLGKHEASDDECEAVLREVNLAAVLDRSREGLDAQVGEGGVMLSGGERQRLAIARTLLAAPPILLLDESTSALDGENEALMRDAIDRVAEGRTVIVIAHRLSTVVDADQIVVMERGRVIGRGLHSELVNTTPLYRRLAEHQLLVPGR
ncbi:ABC transporter ATP-binding protein/permease [Pseudoclavibacter alba]|uniref:ABC transporter ATP-binding protein/permease n=1 Tax=Pseudoclavibacter albus TaxID=272241 RepID=A0ABT2HU39_9MICO|nr:ABC transporter ATP-binding protein [Pseudoclavibacter alba]MCT2041834.1 ABC transporter ATP-binding protein/permease [Pseudoclavibacter alba]